MPGYGVYISKIKLDTAVDGQGQPTRLVRKLLAAFFTPEVLAKSSTRGSRTFAALDHTIVAAIISKAHFFFNYICSLHFHLVCHLFTEFVMNQHPHSQRSLLIDAMNDKCASYRRQKPT